MKQTFKISLSVSLFLLHGMFFASGAACLEHPKYQIRAQVDWGQKRIHVQQEVTFTNPSADDLSELYFHIYPHRKYSEREKEFMQRFSGYFKVNLFPEGFQSGGMDIRSVQSGGRPLSFFIEGKDKTLLRVVLDQALRPGGSIKVMMDFSVEVPHAYGRFGWHKSIMKLSRWYPILSVYGKGGWSKYPFYPFHRPFFAESADYEVELTVPVDQVVISSGTIETETNVSAGQKVLKVKTQYPVREFSLAMSPDYHVYEEDFDGVAVKSYYLPGDRYHGIEAANIAVDLMRFFTKKFGQYPYPEFEIAPVHLGYGGEQMAGMIFIDTRVYQLPRFLSRYFDFLISHETGHQWFFNLVGMDEFTQMWLEEGVNSYFNLEYLEEKYGKDATVIQLPQQWEGAQWLVPNFSFRRARDFRYKMIARTQYDHSVTGKLSSFQEPSSIFSITYGKGSRILAMLKTQIGQEAFDRVFERVFREHAFRNLDQEEFFGLCEEESGKDLRSFFEQWLFTNKKMDYAITDVREGRVTLANKGQIEMPADVEVEFSDGSKKSFVWEGKQKEESILVGEGKRIKKVAVDAQEDFLDIDRTDNNWPRKLNIEPVPLYLPLYDLPIFLPEDSYNLVVGPEIIGNGLGVKASFQKPYEQNFYVSSGFEFGESLHKTRVGYQIENIFQTQTAAGFEIYNRTNVDDGEEDLVSGKLYLRRELWPAKYGLGDINDHISLYLIRNRGVEGSLSLSGREDDRNLSYLKKDEAIIGTMLHLNRSGPYPDPSQGYKLSALLESSGHFLAATQYFYRGAIDASIYQPVTNKTRMAFRVKYGWGYPNDKNLYQLGGWDGLRGFDRKTIRGAHTLLGSVEYRFPIKEDINIGFLDNILGLESVGGVVFFDVGQSWYSDIDDSRLRKDAGLGLRFTINIGSFLEKVVVRADIAQAINESGQDPKIWFGINQAF